MASHIFCIASTISAVKRPLCTATFSLFSYFVPVVDIWLHSYCAQDEAYLGSRDCASFVKGFLANIRLDVCSSLYHHLKEVVLSIKFFSHYLMVKWKSILLLSLYRRREEQLS